MSIEPTNPILLKGEALSSTASPSAPDEYDAGEEWDSYTCPFCLHEADYLYEQDGNIVGCSECIDYIDYLL